jgi:hypothetical protein
MSELYNLIEMLIDINRLNEKSSRGNLLQQYRMEQRDEFRLCTILPEY